MWGDNLGIATETMDHEATFGGIGSPLDIDSPSSEGETRSRSSSATSSTSTSSSDEKSSEDKNEDEEEEEEEEESSSKLGLEIEAETHLGAKSESSKIWREHKFIDDENLKVLMSHWCSVYFEIISLVCNEN